MTILWPDHALQRPWPERRGCYRGVLPIGSLSLGRQTTLRVMGCDATIIGIGPFSDRIVSALGYPAEQYLGVAEGVTVITCVFEAFGSTQSEQLSQCFGVGRWDLGRHVLDASTADLVVLRRDFDERGADDFVALREAGFHFYYMPNGWVYDDDVVRLYAAANPVWVSRLQVTRPVGRVSRERGIGLLGY